MVREVDYDGDGEDSLYYSSTENLHVMVSSMGWPVKVFFSVLVGLQFQSVCIMEVWFLKIT